MAAKEIRALTAKQIRALTGLSQAKFAEYYGIPKKTIEKWESEERTPPSYVLALLERAVRIDFKVE
ncbi:MAG: helix-turn-helix domain-containing protein [Clostridia bacterium]|nr:helix-turn-helix domain-containing protein [Clostridia bacterium]